jgi:hypothetical protein
MTKYQELETQIEALQKEVERLKEEENAEQIDLSTCVIGQLVQIRNGNFDYYEYKDEAGFHCIGGDYYNQDGRYPISHSSNFYDVVKVFPAKIPLPGRFNVFYAKKVLKGDISCLGNSFGFADTPQGDEYWRDIFTGKTHLSFGDMIFIQKWVIQDQ